MKKIYLNIKDKLKTSIRVGTKGKILRSGHEDTYKRTYKNIDISKDFDLRNKIYNEQSLINKNLKSDLKIDEMSFEDLENFYIEKVAEEEIQSKLDINQKVIIHGIKKEVLLNDIILSDFTDRHYEDDKIHPQVKEKISIIHNALIHSLPISKRDLFESFPHYFKEEIESLTNEERQLFPMRKSGFVYYNGKSSVDFGFSTVGLRLDNHRLGIYSFNKKIQEMEIYSHFFDKQINEKYRIFIKQAIEEWGWANKELYIKSIFDKKEENLTFIEKHIKEDIIERDLIDEEIFILKEARNLKMLEDLKNIELGFPINPELKKLIDEKNQFMYKYRMYDMEDTVLLPVELDSPPPDIMTVLRNDKNFDVDSIINSDKERYEKLINCGFAIEEKDLNEKNDDVIRKVNLLSNSLSEYMKQPSPILLPNGGAVALDYLEEQFAGELPARGRINVEEYYKTLLLNEENSKIYNFNYWVDYYEVDSIVLRNIFNYVYFPIQDKNNPSEINRVVYFKDYEYEERRKLISSMSNDEYDEYINSTSERPELEELKRLDYLKYIETANEPRITNRTVVFDALEEDIKNDNPYLYSDVMISVNKQINSIVQKDSSFEKIEVDADLIEKIRKQKEVERLGEIRRSIEYENEISKGNSLGEGSKIDKIN